MAKTCPKCENANDTRAKFCSECGYNLDEILPDDAEQDHNVGRLIANRFRIIERIGVGGMGVVYKAEQTTIARPVVIKMLHQKLTAEREVVQRFHREAQAASMLNHPNTITIYDFGETEDGELYLAMEFLDGITLEQVVTEGPVSISRTLHIVSQIASSLIEAHEKMILHRDLKPENIMLVERGEVKDFVKVLDFGIAKIIQSDKKTKLTQAGVIYGTPYYMSPEQARGDQVDFRTDIYALGAMSYELLTGHVPFNADTPVGVLSKLLTEPVTPIGQYVKLPKIMEDIVYRALEKQKEKRYANMREFADQLKICREKVEKEDSVARLETEQVDISHYMKNGFAREAETVFDTGMGERMASRSRLTNKNSGASDGFLDNEIVTSEIFEAKERARSRVKVVLWLLLVLVISGGGFCYYYYRDTISQYLSPALKQAQVLAVFQLRPAMVAKRFTFILPPVVEEEVVLVLQSKPDKAEIWDQNNTLLGKTPQEIKIKRDLLMVTFTVKAKGYLPYKWAIALPKKDNKWTPEMVALTKESIENVAYYKRPPIILPPTQKTIEIKTPPDPDDLREIKVKDKDSKKNKKVDSFKIDPLD